ncbi:hypothetical protein [Vibrio nereis]|uniref:hypothetical protein n=1 Tax=Vibrio nereis TaxID=693 RepID=UPI002494D4B6|nr:hypothetical protein [Vibrio nereis]
MRAISILLTLFFSSLSYAHNPECDLPTSWAPNMAYVYLVNNNVFTKSDVLHDRTVVVRLASEKLAYDIYRQIHHVTFTLKSGKQVEIITSNEASSEECSLGVVDVFLIKQVFRSA